ncbi:MAG: DUF4132 domain-containing protein [Bacteroidota bacterium]
MYHQPIVNSIVELQDALMDFYNEQTGAQGRQWQLLLDHLFKRKTGSKPKDNWLLKCQQLMEPLDEAILGQVFRGFLQKAVTVVQSIHQAKAVRQLHFFNENFQEALKGMIWSSALLNQASLNQVVSALGLLCYRKKPGHGSVSVKLGNACLSAFAALPFEVGLESLVHFRVKIKYPSVRKQIEKYITAIAEKEGKSADELEERVVSDFGLDTNQQRKYVLGEYQATLTVESVSSVVLQWQKGDRFLKTVPSVVRQNFPEALKMVQQNHKAIRASLPVQRDRIEQFYLKQRSWTYAEWLPFYLEHALVATIARTLIWQLSKAEKQTAAIFYNNKWTNPQGESLDWIDEATEVRLWHPINTPAEQILAWRRWLGAHQIQQAFKQAFREIYLVTDAELNTVDYSNRFAAHILRQHQFAALCKVRGWSYKVLGYWETEQTPALWIPHWKIRAEWWVDADHNGTTTPNGIFNHIFTDQVRFYEGQSQLRMEAIPEIVFSEVMRDIDLFVGVTSIGNDPTWQDGGSQRHDDYWHNYSFSELSESAKMRKSVLQNLVPRLKIASRCSFSGRYLMVRGDIRTYKIHLGSGNILMEPNDQYLCIVPDRKGPQSEKVFLPFEGDQMLSIILSKAFLLAEDQKIKDRTILSQLR